MAENKKSFIDEQMNIIESANYGFDYHYGISFMDEKTYAKIDDALSKLRRIGEVDGHCCHTLRRIWKHQLNNKYKIKELIRQEPRLHAQKFIGKKKIRDFIFKRDGYKCLKCASKIHLTIDHIVPIYLGGENKLMNLQTLCRSCNSRKSTKIEDYR